jgi:hypothetical protein
VARTESGLHDVIDLLAAMAGKKAEVPDRLELFLDMAERMVKLVSAAFSAKSDEVAILILTADGKHLRFAAPRKFATLGTIPVTKRDSIAVNVFQKQQGEVMNNVPMIRHVAFFESVKLRDRVVPIQKMITVPILFAGQAVGVAQVSRKGDSPMEAGPDFNPSDVKKAQDMFEAVAPYFVDARPEKF